MVENQVLNLVHWHQEEAFQSLTRLNQSKEKLKFNITSIVSIIMTSHVIMDLQHVLTLFWQKKFRISFIGINRRHFRR